MTKRGKFNSGQTQQNKMARNLDDLAAFEDFEDTVLPMLKKAIKEGWSPEKIYKMTAAHAAARSVSIALTEQDSGKALAGIKEVLDRSGGKATERREIKHELSGMTDAELEALIASQEADDSATGDRH